MVALQVRNVPDEVRDALSAEAERRGQSLQAYLLGVVTEESRRVANVDVLTAFEDRTDGFGDDPSAAEALRAAREEREQHLASAMGRPTS